jgi:hypothetical protein
MAAAFAAMAVPVRARRALSCHSTSTILTFHVMQEGVPFDTVHLIALWLLREPGEHIPKIKSELKLTEEFILRLSELHEMYLVAGPDDDEQTLAAFKQVWEICSTLDIRHPLYLPPIYHHEAHWHELLTTIFKGIRMRERNPDERFQYEHLCVEGTGNTTVMKVFAIGVAVCCPKFFWFMLTTNVLIPCVGRQPIWRTNLPCDLWARIATTDSVDVCTRAKRISPHHSQSFEINSRCNWELLR